MREWGVNESKRKTVSFDKEFNLHGRMPDVGYAIYKVCISECRNLRFATAMTDVGAVSTRFPYFHTKIEWKLKTKMDYCLALNIMLNDIIQWCWWQRGVRYVLWELRDCIIEWYMLCHIYRTRLSSLRSRIVLEFIILRVGMDRAIVALIIISLTCHMICSIALILTFPDRR